ncbi:hypothetical protein Scep_001230 [Stephania cephalantha]|uniref:Kinesin-like protein n=1 Tax=Stephania cephalantha TaxID=152367 RepID=A0AAP0LBD5_9MAGN
MEKICVAVRVRPPILTQEGSSNGSFWKVEDKRISLHKPIGGSPISAVSYTFDHVFDQDSANSTVYELLTKDIIRAAVQGFNGTAFAYGQTSSGKTYTMNGSQSDPGIVPLAVKDVFHNIQTITNREFLIRVSYMEIYNEDINDLLSTENQKLQVHESLEHGIFVAGLREEIVNSPEQVLELIESGEVNRHFGETNMNARSSRSHTIFRMVIESKGKEVTSSGDYSGNSDAIRVSVLNLVDLAGSERIVKTGAGGVRLKEGKHINKSLLILGNVINKLSEGGKQRGHIPYRDSKLTRILQPALGGNAKTSIICTLAPEEVHIEETKGTLLFASRAKRITNCAQINEILTDAALLKRQKLEIEELQQKLQGSRSEVLEQEILKLRNEMLKYELEREKLAMELEEERKSQKERDRRIKEQQMKIENLSSLVTISDHTHNLYQDQNVKRQSFKEDCADKDRKCEEDAFHTPCLKGVHNRFVAKRGTYSRAPEFSPVPDNFSAVADEDMWLRINKGYTADLNSLQMTPARRTHSLPSSDLSPFQSVDHYKEEVEDLKRQLEQAIQEKNEVERNHTRQLTLTNQLMEEIADLRRESSRIRKIPQILCGSVAHCKGTYKDILSNMECFVAEEQSSSSSKLLSATSEIGIKLLSTLEAHFSMATDNSDIKVGESMVQEQCKVLLEKMNETISTLSSSELASFKDRHSASVSKEMDLDGAQASQEDGFSAELNAMKERCESLEEELNRSSLLLAASTERFESLERECNALKEERTALHQKLVMSGQKNSLLTNKKEKVFRDLEMEIRRRKNLEEQIKQFSMLFAGRQRSVMLFRDEVKAKIGHLRESCQVQHPSLMGIEN